MDEVRSLLSLRALILNDYEIVSICRLDQLKELNTLVQRWGFRGEELIHFHHCKWVMDFTDHVWTECMSPVLGRWMHLDPCEGIYNNPLLYEKGNKTGMKLKHLRESCTLKMMLQSRYLQDRNVLCNTLA
ncbi:Peptide-N(4)-(N-acetyl-beta-glucosaminyl)asparagine amidase [Camellia lanceoleosa]|uniref:Peptide-N(4)-(N-acetyl-beta-glucosaminyl)asparagine amidase n=1 Tax=Camellia lanceoleosa TaxID=1840588 RepID=A0ACC0J666_9ERIC|nr:Peptide-N(4)-(N-acetyl-beta-glucosaminyl)asparagine amidase [Camellia lanceoleosa]